MDVNVNSQTSGASQFGAIQTTETTDAPIVKTPTVTGPPVDNMSKSQQVQTQVTTYNAPTQTPQLPKPNEGKPNEGKETEKRSSEGSFSPLSQDQPVDQPQVEQQQEGGGQDQGGGGGQGADSGPGSDQGGSQGSFQGGSQESFGGASQEVSLEVSQKAEFTSAPITVAEKTSVDSAAAVTTSIPVTDPGALLATTGTVGVDGIVATGITSPQFFSPPTTAGQMGQNLNSVGLQIQQIAEKMVASLPDGPDKFRFADFLSKVGNALRKVQSQLQDMMVADSTVTGRLSKVQLDMNLNQIEQRRADMDKQFQKQTEALAKQQSLGILSKVFVFLMPLLVTILLPVMIMFFFILGPLEIAIMAILGSQFVDSCATMGGKQPFALQALLDVLKKGFDLLLSILAPNISSADKKKAEDIFKFVAVSICLMAMIVVALPHMILGGVMLVTDVMQKSHMFGGIVKACGGSESEAQQADTYAALVVTAGFAIAGIALIVLAPAEVAAAMAETLQIIVQVFKTLANMVLQGLEIGLEALGTIAKTLPGLLRSATQFLASTGSRMAESIASSSFGASYISKGAASGVQGAEKVAEKVVETGGSVATIASQGGRGGAFAEGARDALQAAGKIASEGVQGAIDLVKSILKTLLDPAFLMDATTVGLDVVTTVQEVKMYKLKAELAMIQANIDVSSQLTEAHIKILKKVIQDLQQSMGAIGKQLEQVAGLSKKIISGQSNVVTNLFQG